MPGRDGTVVSVAPDGTTTVSMGESTTGIGAFAAARILVSSG